MLMPKESHKWLSKFTGNNVVTPEEHLYAIGVALENEGVEHEDIAMKLLAMSLNEDAQRWFKGLPENHLASYEYFTKLFKRRWKTKKDRRMLMTRFNQIKKKENKTVNEFDTRFDNLHSHIPNDLCPPEVVVCLLYVNSFEGKFGFILRDKKPEHWQRPNNIVHEIEENILCSKIDPFQYPHSRVEAKTKNSSNNAQDPITLLT
jgi:hypothetical protein